MTTGESLLEQAHETAERIAVFLLQELTQMALGLGIGKTQQAHEDGNTLLIALGHSHGAFCQRPQCLVQRWRLAVTALFQFIKGRFQCGGERREESGEHSVDQRVLGTKVVIDSGQIYFSLTGNHSERGFRKTTFGKQLFRCIKNPIYRIRLRHFIFKASSKRLFETYV